MSRPEPSHIALLLFAGLLARPVEAQSGIRHVPRIERHELGLLAVTGDVVDGPRSSWITGLDQGPTGEPASLGLRGAMQLMDDSALSDVSGTLSTQRAGWDLLLGRHFEDGGVLAFGADWTRTLPSSPEGRSPSVRRTKRNSPRESPQAPPSDSAIARRTRSR
ncbi:MAG: hypothetical protein ACYTFV_08490 [Planctomycetota bacterium]|jgi:hypothetical protein